LNNETRVWELVILVFILKVVCVGLGWKMLKLFGP